MKAGDVARGGRKGHRLQLQLRMQRAGTLLRSECGARQCYWGAPRQSVGQSGGPVPSSVASARPLPCDNLLQPPDTRSIPLSPPPSRRRTRATEFYNLPCPPTLLSALPHCSPLPPPHSRDAAAAEQVHVVLGDQLVHLQGVGVYV